jgi:uncharacterized coiled-coil DUF342 family protein
MAVTAELSPQKKKFYEDTCRQLRDEVEEINKNIQDEVERVQQLAQALQERKSIVIEMYGKAREVLHQDNDLEREEAERAAASGDE